MKTPAERSRLSIYRMLVRRVKNKRLTKEGAIELINNGVEFNYITREEADDMIKEIKEGEERPEEEERIAKLQKEKEEDIKLTEIFKDFLHEQFGEDGDFERGVAKAIERIRQTIK